MRKPWQFEKKEEKILQSVGNCVMCPREMGCLGRSCPEREGVILRCEGCGREVAEAEYEENNGLCRVCEKLLRRKENDELDGTF